uniref:Complex 1 LYR protein domain-containing protein n=2 Tax=Chenopodium quinoa TaxID=63459 RepID=A0A803M0W5_CHEQI
MATHITTPTRTEVVSLLRALLRTAQKFPYYNIREYTKRRTLDGFRQNSSLSDPAHITNAYADGVSQLEVAQRVNANPLSTPSTPKVKFILEMKEQLKTDDLQAKMNTEYY